MPPSRILCRAPDPDPASDAAEQSLSSGGRLLEVFDRSDGVLHRLRVAFVLAPEDRFYRCDVLGRQKLHRC